MIGLTLFSMFFGAGNLIFPPFLGAMAGEQTWPAFLGFAVTAVGFPILGIVAVARTGGLNRLAGRVHPRFAFVFTLITYLFIGPCLAIPRTASTSYAMAMEPFTDGRLQGWLLLAYSIIFFTVAAVMAWNPEKLSEKLGKVTTPCLLVLVLVLTAGCMLQMEPQYGKAALQYQETPFSRGVLDGYQTLDALAALNFGIILALNIRNLGVTEEKAQMRETILAGLFAGGLLFLIYALLAHAGAVEGSRNASVSNGAQVLSNLAGSLYGGWGYLVLAVMFVLACLNTCVGLLSCCSKYFSELFPAVSYHRWLIGWAAVSMLISNAGLDAILRISEPLLNAVYPVALVLILLSFAPARLQAVRALYPLTVGSTFLFSVIHVIGEQGFLVSAAEAFFEQIPFYKEGFGWIWPAALSVLICTGISVGSSAKNVVE
ncbi:MAG: branched-chain amino acid transport system II carrier protein [Eubacteriales bacterium]|nr:branched-chain amino acid transport system II carrier protein [Eubacteriales bacterium]